MGQVTAKREINPKTMTQLIVTIDSNSSPSLIKKAIELIKGVTLVTERKAENKPEETQKNVETHALKDVSSDIQSLIGIASDLKDIDPENDERLSYLLRK